MTVQGSSGRMFARAAARAKEDLPNLVSLLVFCGATALIFRSWEFALIVTASLGFHELGHAAALSYYRLGWRISFGPVGAMTWSHRRERAQLSHLGNAYVHLAGPFFSLLLALIALGLNALWQPESSHLLVLANFSAQVGFLNLLPLGLITDGGKIFRRMVVSLDGKPRQWAVVMPVAATVFMLTLYTLVEVNRQPPVEATPFLLGLLLVGLWMAGGLFIESTRLSNADQAPSQPMTPRQVYIFVLLVWDILVFYLIVIAVTPFWLTPEYLLGSLQNVTALLDLLVRLFL
jgi:hypothetical protein